MAIFNNKPASVGLSDPKLVRQTEAALAQSALIARGKTTVTSDGELILPNTTLAVGANSISTTTSANNSSADLVTVYSGQGAIYASSIDQTVNQTVVNQIGVNSIVAGNNITITSTGTSEGTGIVTVNAVLDGNNAPGGTNTQVQFNDVGVFGGNAGFTFNKTTGVLAAPFFSGPGNSLSNIQGTNVTGAVAFAGTANSVALANVTGAGNIASINLTGSTSNILYGNGVFAAVTTGAGIANGTSNVTVPAVNGNVNLVSAGNTTMVVTGTGANITGTLSVSSNANIGNIGATLFVGNISGTGNSNVGNLGFGAGVISGTGNITAGNIIGNGQALTGLAGANVSGFVPNANVANTAFSVAAANVSGLGNIATINLDGNSSNVLRGDGTFAADANSSYGNSNVATFLASYGSNTMTTTGNVSVGNIIGNGQALTGLAGANVSGQVGNALVASTVYTNAQPNITSVGTLTSVSVSGNANVGNLGTTTAVITTGNITTINSGLMQNGNSNIAITANSNIVVNVGAANYTFSELALNVTTNPPASPAPTLNGFGLIKAPEFNNGTSNITINANSNTWVFSSTGNLILPANTFSIYFANGSQAALSSISNGNSNVSVATSNGNVTINAVGNATMTVTGTGANITGYANVTGNVTGGNISTTGQITSTQAGNLSNGGGQLYLNGTGNNRIDFNTNGTGAPTFTTRSAGAKVVLFPNLGVAAADYALGIDSGTFWSGVPDASG